MGKILIQETDKSVMEAITFALEIEGFDVWSFNKCDQEFLYTIEVIKPHVVLLDYYLDGHLSIEICGLIKQQHPGLPVIALSCTDNIIDKYSAYGFSDCIPKPFDLNFLYEKINAQLPAVL